MVYLRRAFEVLFMFAVWYASIFFVSVYSGMIGSKVAILDPTTIGVICCFVEIAWSRVRE